MARPSLAEKDILNPFEAIDYFVLSRRKFSGTFYSRGCCNRLIKSIYLQKCTVPDKLRTVHSFFLQFYDFSIFQYTKQFVIILKANSISMILSSFSSDCLFVSVILTPFLQDSGNKKCLSGTFIDSKVPNRHYCLTISCS